jgi:hypothetical protein
MGRQLELGWWFETNLDYFITVSNNMITRIADFIRFLLAKREDTGTGAG